jgi:Uma2 family endonuclease
MSVLVLDRWEAERLKASRAESGADRWDEVLEGVYVMSPLPNNRHQEIVAQLIFILETTIGLPGLGDVFPGVNVSDREDWTENYRCPDVAVFLRGGTAVNRETFWLGGPDFAVEVVSPEDRVREKLPFYAKVGVRELLVVVCEPWALELHRLDGGMLRTAGESTLEEPAPLTTEVVPLVFRLRRDESRPRIDVAETVGPQSWTV